MVLRLPRRMNKTVVFMLCLFVISYVIFMLHQLPVTTVVSWVPQKTLQRSGVQLTGLSGTIWHGQTAQLRFNGFSLSNLSWQLHALPLLWGDIALDFKYRQTDAFGKGNAITGFSGAALELASVQCSFPAAQLMPLFYGFPMALDGQLSADIKQATISKGQQLSLQGEMLWREAALSAPQHIVFGDLQVKMQAKDRGTVLTVQDQGGPLQLQGQISVQGNGRYETNISIAARNTASKALTQSISILGARDAQGNVQIRYKGKLPNW